MGYIGDCIGEYQRGYEGDTRSLDYSLCRTVEGSIYMYIDTQCIYIYICIYIYRAVKEVCRATLNPKSQTSCYRVM